ncbi:hypothetical protein KP509_31G042100 [Ceratopteris richardii]|uniref:Uncharacterized protein n=1 Tax=Ceratopteris richardii TaxID=49495 RepID=A0A8T2QZA0_CERRI|nr:hypothetical protein KP509_31G042100 [Ceratopteris richardii]
MIFGSNHRTKGGHKLGSKKEGVGGKSEKIKMARRIRRDSAGHQWLLVLLSSIRGRISGIMNTSLHLHAQREGGQISAIHEYQLLHDLKEAKRERQNRKRLYIRY